MQVTSDLRTFLIEIQCFFNNKALKTCIGLYQTDPKHLPKITLAAIQT